MSSLVEGGAGTGWTVYPPAKCSGKTLLWVQLSNSGDALKLMVPSLSWKAMSGQNNYLGTVTSHKIKETEMGYRGSKSGIIPVKEQRVDGSLFKKIAINLRCTLMGFERNYPIKIPSNQIHNNRKFSSLIYKSTYADHLLSITLDPWYVTGLIDGSFQIRIRKNPKYKTGWVISPVFSIGLHKSDLALLKAVQA